LPGYLYDAGVVINFPIRCAATAANLLITSIAEYNRTRYCPPLTCCQSAALRYQCRLWDPGERKQAAQMEPWGRSAALCFCNYSSYYI